MQVFIQTPCPWPEQGKEKVFSRNQFPGIGRIFPGTFAHPGSLLGNADTLKDQRHPSPLPRNPPFNMQALTTRMSKQVLSKL